MVKVDQEHSKTFVAALKEMRGANVAVVGHMHPDGDCIGSQVALCRVLRNMGIEAVAVNQDPVPPNLLHFVGDTPFLTPKSLPFKEALSLYVDCADSDRPGKTLSQFFPNPFLNIDHHLSNPGYAKYNIVDVKTAATSEILADLIMDSELEIDATTAQALYVGIATDTVQFRAPSTNYKVFAICAKLIERGAKPDLAALYLYESEPFRKLELLRLFLGTLKIELDGKACIGVMDDEMYEKSNAKPFDSDGFVDYTRCVEGVEIGVLLEEHHGNLKGSLRAKKPSMRLDLLAGEFGGGGHACASGFSVPQTSIKQFYPSFLETIKEHRKKYCTNNNSQ